MEEIKTINDDIGKSTDNMENPIKGNRAVIDGELYEWNGKDWVLTPESNNK